MKRSIILVVVVLFLTASYGAGIPQEKTGMHDSVVRLGNDTNWNNKFFSGRKATDGVYMSAYFSIYRDYINGGTSFSSDELSDVIDYYVSNDNLQANLDYAGTRSNERISDILERAGVNFHAGDYCYMSYSIDSELCCVDAASNPQECYSDSVCQGGKCVKNSGGGCYISASVNGESCCVDYTVSPGYCYLDSSCGGDLCVESPGPIIVSAPTPGCGAFSCGNGLCEGSIPYDPSYDEAVAGSECCCEEDCWINCSGSTTVNEATTTTFTTSSESNPAATPDASSSYITSSIYGEPCCVDGTLPPGFCFLESASENGVCVDRQTACYMTMSVYGRPCCVDASIPPGYCYQDITCQDGVCA